MMWNKEKAMQRQSVAKPPIDIIHENIRDVYKFYGSRK